MLMETLLQIIKRVEFYYWPQKKRPVFLFFSRVRFNFLKRGLIKDV